MVRGSRLATFQNARHCRLTQAKSGAGRSATAFQPAATRHERRFIPASVSRGGNPAACQSAWAAQVWRDGSSGSPRVGVKATTDVSLYGVGGKLVPHKKRRDVLTRISQQRSAEDEEPDRKVDDQTRHVDERGHERARMRSPDQSRAVSE